LFEEIAGFPEEMETSEEFTLCLNATSAGASITAFPELGVIHQGSPETLTSFFKREVWHGRGDFSNVASILASKVAILTLVFLVLHFCLLIFITTDISNPTLELLTFMSIPLLCLFASFIKFMSFGFKYFIVNSFTFYLYFLARSLSFFSALLSKKSKKRSRA
jgi:hypothetical protein